MRLPWAQAASGSERSDGEDSGTVVSTNDLSNAEALPDLLSGIEADTLASVWGSRL